ncbi:MAG: pyridoxamine 5'-phosphate oxidase family protein [Candidatus Marinimicrobia bacterium]|jgi:uncharacterized protein|nr:pyridoxamine 5'-phosphate oxidase family protein [Candidatus Neomarinimicrobiota bacterium]MBT4360354.1 pyridoxamine 5'-phosphate oxidase family protein [Candidatus Neomarinimicrobiota bacterium]MBT4714571.1 pyridoxamine 5'-phosphate oxidase family protein [Candidatus Neomarinimicrobiota bacterium]MBT4946610.1 pyridoxamine 5'-phosphate oxidase family protein [Candidatus Neomarinimicrobiota bacterium]MBT5270311.1 pyridoxamine 5'-phosphate oxidase family protein [Candidatus Neomarinimicrobiota
MKPLRRQDRQLSPQEALQLLEGGEYGIVSTVDAAGQPYGVPVNYVLKKGCIDFHSATEGHKIDNFQNSGLVSFCVVGETEVIPEKLTTRYESIIVFGSISERVGTGKTESLTALVEKYAPKHTEVGQKSIQSSGSETRVFSISIDRITGKALK